MQQAPALPQNRRDCIARIQEAFQECPRPDAKLLAPDGGIDGPYVHKNWGHLSRDDVEALDDFGSYLAEDLTYMSSHAFRYFMPSVMILFLARPEAIEFGGFISVVSRCEAVFLCCDDGYSHGQVALTPAQAVAFRDWFGQLMTILRKFRLDDFEQEYADRLRALRVRSKHFVPETDSDAETMQRLLHPSDKPRPTRPARQGSIDSRRDRPRKNTLQAEE